jgi:HAD superfamily hydrolase (TIGR01509 family)
LASEQGCELIIFDCDGVLVDSEVLSARVFKAVLSEIGVEAPSSVIEGAIGLKQADIFARITAATGRAIGPETMAQLWPRTRLLFEAELQATAGLALFLDGLETPHCVASSSHLERIRLSLQLTRLERYFGDAIFSTHQVARGKPAPDVYLHAAKTMRADPARCVVIEDSLPGVQGARAAGMTPIGFLGGSHIRPGHEKTLREGGAVLTTGSWPEVARWLANRPAIAV